MTNSALADQLRDKYKEISLLRQELNTLETVIGGVKDRISNLQGEEDLHVESWEVLRIVLEKFSSESLNLLAQMVNKGVSSIFDDRDYKIIFEVTDLKRKSVKIFLEETKGGKLVRSKVPDAIGGGVQVVLSFILNVFLIRIYGLRPFMVMDEAFTQISSQYLDNFLQFLRYLIDEMGFTFLWVSHDQRVFPHFDKCYEVRQGTVKQVATGPSNIKLEPPQVGER